MSNMQAKLSRRRALLAGAAMLGAAALGGCSTAQIASFEDEWASVAGQVQNIVAQAAAYVPTIESIAETAASLFGPAYVTLVTAGSALFNQLVQALVNVVGVISPPTAVTLRRLARRSTVSPPVLIGTTPGGQQVYGWRA